MAGWDSGAPVAALGRYYLVCPVNAVTTLRQTAAGGAIGDAIDYLWLYPATTTPGGVTLSDGGVTNVYAWPPGITLADTRPIFVPLNLGSRAGAWIITTGLNIAVTAAGKFS